MDGCDLRMLVMVVVGYGYGVDDGRTYDMAIRCDNISRVNNGCIL